MKTELERYKEALEVVMEQLRRTAMPIRLCNTQDKVNAILNPPPEMEEVEVESWANFTLDGRLYHSGLSQAEAESCSARDGLHAVKLTGTYKRPKPQPAERSVSVEALVKDSVCNSTGGYVTAKGDDGRYSRIAFYDFPECHGKTGTLTFTWTEPAE